MSRNTIRPTRGFTVVELLIATSVFSLVLILITTGVLRFTHQYYKGVIASRTQDTARTIADDITRAIQFNGGQVAPLVQTGNPAGAGGFCFGPAKRYRYYLNSQVTDQPPNNPIHQHPHALVSDTTTGCDGSSTPSSVQNDIPLTDPNARELLGEHMRLVVFDLSAADPDQNLWTLKIRIAYGDDDLLCSPSIAPNHQGGCEYNGSLGTSLNGKDDVTCKGDSGSDFCAVSELTTTIDRRVKGVQ